MYKRIAITRVFPHKALLFICLYYADVADVMRSPLHYAIPLATAHKHLRGKC